MTGKREVIGLLTHLGIVPRKSRGQNFLIDSGSILKGLRFAGVTENEEVLEVGPGLGALTKALFEQAKTFRAVDIEERFLRHLRDALPEVHPESWILSDIRQIELPNLGFTPTKKCVVVSNVPYSLSSEMILWVLEQRAYIQRASLLLQREFAERIAAGPGGKDYGSLSVLTSLYADVRLGPRITGGCFYPPAEVESRFVEIKLLESPRIAIKSHEVFEKVVRAAFSKRRKTLINALTDSEMFGAKEKIEQELLRAKIEKTRRAETLALDEFVRLYFALS